MLIINWLFVNNIRKSTSYTQYYFFANASKTICFGSKSLQIYTLENGGFKLGFWSK